MPKHNNKDSTADLHCMQMHDDNSGTKDLNGQMLNEHTEELKMDRFHKKGRKKKRVYLENWNTESGLPESQVSYEEETVEKGETVSPSRNMDELQTLCEWDCTPKKHKKKKRHIEEFHSTEESQNASVSQCREDLERVEEGGLCTVKELSSEGQEETEAEELYETLFLDEADDPSTELLFKLREV
jgi:hypothetical protein